MLQDRVEATTPGTRSIKAAMVSAVLCVFVLAYLDLRREQARALDDFTAEQAALAASFASTLESRMGRVFSDLESAIDAADGGASERALRRMVADGAVYREANVFLAPGGRVIEIVPDVARSIARSAILSAARAAILKRLGSGEVEAISPPLRGRAPASSERLRLFGLRRAGRIAVFVVDTDRFFDGMRPGASKTVATSTRWLVVDDAHRWVEFGQEPSGTSLRWRLEEGSPVSPEVGVLLAKMALGEDGALLLGREAAASLTLDRRSAVAGFAAVHVAGMPPWSVAVIASAMRVRDRARLAAWRLGAATGLAGLLVALFGLVITRQQERDRRLTEALRLAEATAALRERSEKIVEAIPVGVLSLDADLRVISVNPYLFARGVKVASSLSGALPNLQPEELGALEALILEARSNRQPCEKMDLRLHFGEALRDVDAYVIPLATPLADVDSFLVLHDRTEMRVLERNLVRAEKLATIGTLAAGVAHELGTPLGIISGRSEQIMARLPAGEATEPMRKNVASILTQVDKVSTTIRQLLDFARVRPVELDVVTPAQALESVAALLDHRFRHAKVALEVDAPPTVEAVAADPGQLEQVFVNLLMNACDACDPGGHVWVRAQEQDGRILFEVKDDGAGIAPELLSSVLDPFFTTKKRGQGTGLGLTIAADIVKNHGGSLELESSLGRGTTVRVFLPTAERGSP